MTIAAALSCACRSAPVPKTKQPLVGWRPTGAWSGHGDTQTDSFNIETGQWRIKWETKNESPPGAGTFRVTAHSAVSGRPIMLAVEHKGVGRDIAYLSDDPRLFELVIESSGVDWSVAVEEGVVSYAP